MEWDSDAYCKVDILDIFGLSWTPHQACDRFGGLLVIHVDDFVGLD